MPLRLDPRTRTRTAAPLLLLLAGALAACATRAPRAPASTVADGIHWFRNAAEQKAVYVQTYQAALRAARELSAGKTPGSWAVVMDVDETILDNSEFQKRLGTRPFDPKDWSAWVDEGQATLLPGAKTFIDGVNELQGRVALVTNRAEAECPATEDNLRRVGIRYALILCARGGNGDKNPRFRRVAEGTAGQPPLEILLWVGDNIQDFPALTQATADFSQFGTRYFALPNPMYGSWMSVPPR